MSPAKPLAVLLGGTIALFAWVFTRAKPAAAQDVPALAPGGEPPSPDQAQALSSAADVHDAAAATHAATALSAAADHSIAEQGTAQALERAAAAERQVAQSQQAAAASPDPAVAQREAAAAQQAAAEAQRQRALAAQLAQKALDAKAKKAAAVAATATATQKAAAARAAVQSAPAAQNALQLGAQLLKEILTKNPTPAEFGFKGHPSSSVQSFQRLATKNGHKLTVDGIVGPQTRAVAELVGVTLPPRPGASPTTHAAPPAPSSSAVSATLARALAAQVEKNLRNPPAKNIYNYDRKLMASFQKAAGIAQDGLYGGGTRAALIYYGAKNVPAALFAPKTGTYKPPA
jgi:peptidoglycan hydrolase-like protein with peptidoglycan-binding domain